MKLLIVILMLAAILPFAAHATALEDFFAKAQGNWRSEKGESAFFVQNGEGNWELHGSLNATEMHVAYRIDGDKLFQIINSHDEKTEIQLQVLSVNAFNLKFVFLNDLHKGDVRTWKLTQDDGLFMTNSTWLQVQTGSYKEVGPFAKFRMKRAPLSLD